MVKANFVNAVIKAICLIYLFYLLMQHQFFCIWKFWAKDLIIELFWNTEKILSLTHFNHLNKTPGWSSQYYWEIAHSDSVCNPALYALNNSTFSSKLNIYFLRGTSTTQWRDVEKWTTYWPTVEFVNLTNSEAELQNMNSSFLLEEVHKAKQQVLLLPNLLKL